MKAKRTDTMASGNADNMGGTDCAAETSRQSAETATKSAVGSFETYCRENYTEDVAACLADRLAERTLSVGRRSQHVPEPQRINLVEAKIGAIRFHESDPTTVYAEMIVDTMIELVASFGCMEYTDTVKQKYKVDTAIVFLGRKEAVIHCFSAEIFERWGSFERDYALNEYLLPVLEKDQYDAFAEEMLAKYYPEALIAPEKMDGEELARRMGLTVIYTSISRYGTEFGRISANRWASRRLGA